MKIVFVQPKAYRHKPAHVFEPLNLGYLASYLKTNGFSDITIRISALENEDEIITDASQADIVGFTATSPMMTDGRLLAKKIRKLNPETFIVFGGTHPSAVPECTLEDQNIDVVVRGEGEVTFLELVRAVQTRSPLNEIDGISYRQRSEIRHCPDRELIRDINKLPFPARDLLLQDKFIDKFAEGTGKRLSWVLSSRGCPFSCTYCASHQVWTRNWRYRSHENLFEEIKELVEKYNLQHINFADDTFTVNRERCLQFCDLMMREKQKITWACNVHVNTATRDMFETMRMAGCTEVWMGVESGSPLILKELKKSSDIGRIKDAFCWSKEAGLKRHAYLMIGSPSETLDTISETERLVDEIQPDYAALTILTPYPGCELFQQAKDSGYAEDNQDWSVVDLHFSVTMPTKYMTKEQISEEHDKLIERLEKYQRKPPGEWLKLLTLIFHKITTSSPKEYPSLVLKFWRYIQNHAW